MKLDKMVIANALATTTAIMWVACSAFVAIWPGMAWTVANWWKHGLLIAVKGSWSLDFRSFLLGGVSLVIAAWISGYIFGWSWEKLSKK